MTSKTLYILNIDTFLLIYPITALRPYEANVWKWSSMVFPLNSIAISTSLHLKGKCSVFKIDSEKCYLHSLQSS